MSGWRLGLIPPFGLGGAVAALCAGQFVFATLLTRLVADRAGVRPGWIPLWARTAFVGPPVAVAAVLASAPIHLPVVRAVVAAAAGAAAFVAVLALARPLRVGADELRRLTDALPPRPGEWVTRAMTAARLVDLSTGPDPTAGLGWRSAAPTSLPGRHRFPVEQAGGGGDRVGGSGDLRAGHDQDP